MEKRSDLFRKAIENYVRSNGFDPSRVESVVGPGSIWRFPIRGGVTMCFALYRSKGQMFFRAEALIAVMDEVADPSLLAWAAEQNLTSSHPGRYVVSKSRAFMLQWQGPCAGVAPDFFGNAIEAMADQANETLKYIISHFGARPVKGVLRRVS